MDERRVLILSLLARFQEGLDMNHSSLGYLEVTVEISVCVCTTIVPTRGKDRQKKICDGIVSLVFGYNYKMKQHNNHQPLTQTVWRIPEKIHLHCSSLYTYDLIVSVGLSLNSGGKSENEKSAVGPSRRSNRRRKVVRTKYGPTRTLTKLANRPNHRSKRDL